MSDYELGINASRALREHFDAGIENRFKTIFSYKLKGIMKGIRGKIMRKILLLSASILNIPENLTQETAQNSFKLIESEKRYMAKYLRENSDINNFIEAEAILFEKEAENWGKLYSYYSQIAKRGIFISFPRAVLLINKMADTLDEIIAIEEAIIAGPTNS